MLLLVSSKSSLCSRNVYIFTYTLCNEEDKHWYTGRSISTCEPFYSVDRSCTQVSHICGPYHRLEPYSLKPTVPMQGDLVEPAIIRRTSTFILYSLQILRSWVGDTETVCCICPFCPRMSRFRNSESPHEAVHVGYRSISITPKTLSLKHRRTQY